MAAGGRVLARRDKTALFINTFVPILIQGNGNAFVDPNFSLLIMEVVVTLIFLFRINFMMIDYPF